MIFKSESMVYQNDRYTVPVWVLDTDTQTVIYTNPETFEEQRWQFHTDHIRYHLHFCEEYHPDRLQKLMDSGEIYKYLDELDTRVTDEDNVLGRISDERFTMMSAGYEDEQKKLKSTVSELTALIDTAEQKSSDVTAFLDVVHKYEHIEKLTPEIMHELIEKIVVHAPDKSSGKRVQQIEIYYRFDVATSSLSVETGKYGKKAA